MECCHHIEAIPEDQTTIAEWDIDREVKSSHFKDIADLSGYISEGVTGDIRDVARKIRPVLEAHLRLRFLHQFQEHEWLGQFISKIRGASDTSPLAGLQGGPLEELEGINDYSKRFHHEQNPGGADRDPIDDGELRAYVERTLTFIGSA